MNALCSMFSQSFKLMPRTEFAQMIKQIRAVRHCEALSIPRREEPER